uniref:Uncharacterized protein n=1 Tax=Oryza brachyantha TaxID=4533 RepID=J3NA82_ORYBR
MRVDEKARGHTLSSIGSPPLDVDTVIVSNDDKGMEGTIYPSQDDNPKVKQQPPSCDVNRWTLDTMARHHHTFDRRLLDEQPPVSSSEVIGSVKTEGFKVPSVRYVEHATRNVISVAQLADDHGLVTVFEGQSCHVRVNETGEIIGKGSLCQGQYELDYLLIHQPGDIDPTGVHDEGERGGGGGRGGGDSGGGVNNNTRGRDEEEEEGGRGGSGDDTGGGCGGDKEKKGDDDRKGEKKKDILEKAFVTSGNERRHSTEFLLDSGACFHLTWNSAILFPYPPHLQNSTRSPIESIGGVGPGSPIRVEGTGYLNGNMIKLDAVRLAPRSEANLVSISQLGLQYGVSTEFGRHGVVEIKAAFGTVIGTGRRRNHHFVLERLEPGILYAQQTVPCINFFGLPFQSAIN